MNGRLALVLALGVVLAACSFDTRSGALRCESQADCSDGRQCVSEWCVDPNAVGDASSLDAPASDANVVGDAGDLSDASDLGDAVVATDAAVADAGAPCGNGTCEAGETAAACPADCSVCTACTGGSCDEDCGGAGVDCAPTCDGAGCDCNYDCTEVNRCGAICTAGVTCNIDCTNANRCNRTQCTGGAACLIDCTNTNRCRFNECLGGSGEQSCPNNIIVCNRDCP